MDSIGFLCAFLLFHFVVLKLVRDRKCKPLRRLKLPPGPKPLPIIGNMHQLHGSPLHHLLRDLAEKYGPLMHLKVGEVSTIIITSPEVAKEIFRTNDIIFSSRPSHHLAFKIVTYNFTDVMFSPYGDYWRQLRKICTLELLSSKLVQSFRSIREEEVFNLMQSIFLQKGSVFNVSRRIFSLGYWITSRIAFGRRNEDTERYVRLIDEVNKYANGMSLADMFPSVKLLQVMSIMRYKLEPVQKQVDQIHENILMEHKEKFRQGKLASGHENILMEHKEKFRQGKLASGEAKEDLVYVLLRIQERGDFEPQLTDTNIKAVIFDIFSAGSETSSTTVEWAISEMIKHPEVIRRAQDEVRNVFDEKGNVDESRLHELKYLNAIIKETLRIHPSAPLSMRECGEQCEINGYEIPARARVIVNLWAIGRDPRHWVEAEKFNPERFLGSKVDYKGNDFEYIPFGAGRRSCPGISFAIPNIELVLAQLLFHFDWKFPDELKQELDMTEQFGVTMRRKNDLFLIPIPYGGSCLRRDN